MRRLMRDPTRARTCFAPPGLGSVMRWRCTPRTGFRSFTSPARRFVPALSWCVGCLILTWDDNIQASYHIRFGKTGGVAYRHVGANYIAYFTHFILAGAYEGTYLFDALFNNPSMVKATGVYSDTHGQSA